MSGSHQHNDYLLGVNQQELQRLQFQHSVWGHITRKFLNRLGVSEGWRCLDAGAGPGLVSMDLRDIVGEKGEVTALDPSEFYLNWLREQASRRGWTNIRCLQGTAEQTAFASGYYDIIFVRWVVAFVPDVEAFLTKLFAALRPGGVIAIQDYYYEGLSLYPQGGVCDSMADFVRAYYKFGGGDAYVAGRIPAFFSKHGLQLVDFTPNCLAGGSTSAIMEWAHGFFPVHIPIMAEKGIITRRQADAFLDDWNSHRRNPDMLFFSPLVVDVAGRRKA